MHRGNGGIHYYDTVERGGFACLVARYGSCTVFPIWQPAVKTSICPEQPRWCVFTWLCFAFFCSFTKLPVASHFGFDISTCPTRLTPPYLRLLLSTETVDGLPKSTLSETRDFLQMFLALFSLDILPPACSSLQSLYFHSPALNLSSSLGVLPSYVFIFKSSGFCSLRVVVFRPFPLALMIGQVLLPTTNFTCFVHVHNIRFAEHHSNTTCNCMYSSFVITA